MQCQRLPIANFSRIASKYHTLRTTDSEPIMYIAGELKNLTSIEAVDIGCGTGRYDLLLCGHLGDKLRLTCADANGNMLEALDKYLTKHGISNFTSMRSEAENLPFPSNALDCVCTFNAVHHFNLPEFLLESARILNSGGYLFIYTRLREQNEKKYLGSVFPRVPPERNPPVYYRLINSGSSGSPKSVDKIDRIFSIWANGNFGAA